MGKWLLAALTAVSTVAIVPTVASASVGDLDPAFGTNGLVRIEPTGNQPTKTVGANVAAAPGGAIYVARLWTSSVEDTVSIIRLDGDGNLDESYGVAGSRDLSTLELLPGAVFKLYRGIQVTPDGGLIVGFSAGTGSPFTGWKSVFIKLDTGGSIDTSYGDAGIARVPASGYVDPGTDVFDVDSDGRVLVGGSASVIRLTADGAPDPGFGGDGTADVPFDPDIVEVASDDSVYALGTTGAVVHLLGDGSSDPAYGDSGSSSFAEGFTDGYMLRIAPDGSIYVGYRSYGFENGIETFEDHLIRLTPEGQVDDSFSADPGLSGRGDKMVIDPEGRLLVPFSGSPGEGHPGGMLIQRLEPSGQLDETFGYAGSAYAVFPPARDTLPGLGGTFASSLLLRPDGSVIAAGGVGAFSTAPRVGIAKFTADGQGPDDADADGIRDDADRCPFLGAAPHDGCWNVRTEIWTYADGRRLRGGVSSAYEACLDRARIQILRLKRGSTRPVASTVAHKRLGSTEAKFRTKVLPRGHYMVRVRHRFAKSSYSFGPLVGKQLGAGFCRSSKSSSPTHVPF